MSATLPQLRGTARLTPCPDCGEPHGIVYRLGQTPVVECELTPPGEMRLRLHNDPVLLIVGAVKTPEPKKPRRNA